MTAREAQPDAATWSWVRDGGREWGGCLIFARGASAEQIIQALGMDPGLARMLPMSRAGEALSFPAYDDEAKTICPWARVGRSGDWGFAISESALDIVGYHQDAGVRLSAGTEAAVVTWTPTISDLLYLVDGDMATLFDLDMPWERSGSNPGRFLAEMRRLGLETEPPDEPELEEEEEPARIDPLIRTLQMLTLALGIRLSGEAAEGPLLTVQRRPDSQAGGML